MKRFIALSTAVLILSAVAFTTTMWKPKEAKALSPLLLGEPTSLEFNGINPNKISHVGIDVKRGWLNSDIFELDIEITGINGGDRYHGRQVVQLSSEMLFSSDRDVAHILVEWNDLDTNHEDEEYTVCVQVLQNGTPFGEMICRDGFIHY